jgi:hypothetical protein
VRATLFKSVIHKKVGPIVWSLCPLGYWVTNLEARQSLLTSFWSQGLLPLLTSFKSTSVEALGVRRRKKMNLIINNRAGGNGPIIAQKIAKRLRELKW